jgi:hypothetical protein
MTRGHAAARERVDRIRTDHQPLVAGTGQAAAPVLPLAVGNDATSPR